MRIQYKRGFNVHYAVCLSSFQVKEYLNLRIEMELRGDIYIYIYIYICVCVCVCVCVSKADLGGNDIIPW